MSAIRPVARAIFLVRLDDGAADGLSPEAIFGEDRPAALELARERADRRRRKRSLGGPIDAADLAAQFRASALDPATDLAAVVRGLGGRDPLSLYLDAPVLSYARTMRSHRQAGDFAVKVPWSRLPIDPRLIRAALVLGYDGVVDASSVGPDGSHELPARRENLRTMGFADEVALEADDSGTYLSFAGRTLVGLLLDAKVPRGARRAIGGKQSILESVRAILDSHPSGLLFRGPVLERGAELVEVGDADVPRTHVPPETLNAAQPGQQVPGAVPAAKGGDGGESLWEAISGLALYNGLLARVDHDVVVLFEPETVYKGSPVDLRTGKPTFPGEHRRAVGDTHPVRRLVYGRQVERLRIHRKFGGAAATPIVVAKSANPDAKDPAKRLISARWPRSAVATRVGPDGSASEERKVIAVRGVTSPKVLERMARAAYETMGRQQIRVTFDTREVASHSSRPGFDPTRDPDLLRLRFGDPIQLVVAAEPGRGDLDLAALADFSANTSAAKIAGELVARGFPPELAARISKISKSAGIPREFRTQSVAVTVDAESGLAIKIEASNYVKVRADPDEAEER